MATYRSKLEEIAEQIANYAPFSSRYDSELNNLYAQQKNGNPYQSQIDSYAGQLANFERNNQNWKNAQNYNQQLNNFKYDPNSDNLYKQYAQTYTRNAQKAADDTMGMAAARTGGLAGSYAMTAANQTYNNIMNQLNDKVPELAQLARSNLQSNYERNLGLSDKEKASLQGMLNTYSNLGATRLSELQRLIDNARGLRSDEYNQKYVPGYNRTKDSYSSYSTLENMAMQDEQLEWEKEKWAEEMALRQAEAAAAAARASSGGRRSSSYDDDDDDISDIVAIKDGNKFYINGYGYVSRAQAEALYNQGKVRKDYNNYGQTYYIPNNADGSTKAIDYKSDTRYGKTMSDAEYEAYRKKFLNADYR